MRFAFQDEPQRRALNRHARLFRSPPCTKGTVHQPVDIDPVVERDMPEWHPVLSQLVVIDHDQLGRNELVCRY